MGVGGWALPGGTERAVEPHCSWRSKLDHESREPGGWGERRDRDLLPRGLSSCWGAEPVSSGLGSTIKPAACTGLPVTILRINMVTNSLLPTFCPCLSLVSWNSQQTCPRQGTPSSPSYSIQQNKKESSFYFRNQFFM